MGETAYIGLGCNVGDRLATLNSALVSLSRIEGTGVVTVSGAWESSWVGPEPQDDVLNAAAGLQTDLGPRELLDALLEVERLHGRERLGHWGPRTLDLDLLLYADRQVDEPGLCIPHPRLEQRRFVLEPLIEIAPQLAHPVHGRQLSSFLEEVRALREERVQRLEDLAAP